MRRERQAIAASVVPKFWTAVKALGATTLVLASCSNDHSYLLPREASAAAKLQGPGFERVLVAGFVTQTTEAVDLSIHEAN